MVLRKSATKISNQHDACHHFKNRPPYGAVGVDKRHDAAEDCPEQESVVVLLGWRHAFWDVSSALKSHRSNTAICWNSEIGMMFVNAQMASSPRDAMTASMPPRWGLKMMCL